jgi:ketosteroid isomerase-like protein
MDEQGEIARAIDGFINAYNAGDLEAVLAYYGDDLIKLRHGALPETKVETAARIAAVFEQFDTRVEVVNEEIGVSGDQAFTRGTFQVTLTPKAGGESQLIERRYLEIWRRENGRWLVVRTMDNLP